MIGTGDQGKKFAGNGRKNFYPLPENLYNDKHYVTIIVQDIYCYSCSHVL